jgi:lysophospholipase L1-like esterase
MVTWDNTLLRACARYPNMRVFNWAAYAKTKWYISDGVHFTSTGYAVRSRMIAQALARAFPRPGRAPAAWSANPRTNPPAGRCS